MASIFPPSIDVFTPDPPVDNFSDVMGNDVGALQDAIIAVQTFLTKTSLSAQFKNVEVLSADKTLVDADFLIQRLDCNGVGRVVKVPAGAAGNHAFWIINSSAGAYALTIKSNNGVTTHATVNQNQGVLAMPDGNGGYLTISVDLSGYLTKDGLKEWDEQGSDPSSPASGKWKLYFKAGGAYIKNSAGVVIGPLGSGGGGGLAFGGRLTGLSNTPIPTVELTAITSLRLTPYKGNQFPLWNGTSLEMQAFSEKTLTFNATPHPANSNFDVFYFDDGGAKRIGSVKWKNSGQAVTAATNANPCVITSAAHGLANGDIVDVVLAFANKIYIGQYEASSVATNTITFTGINSTSDGAFLGGSINCRGVGAGTSELELVNGVWLNKYAITAYYSASSASVAARYGTYVGTFRTTSTAAQTEHSKSRAFIWNLYNQVENELYCKDPTDSWTYTILAWRSSNGATGLTPGVGRVECVVGISGCEAQAIANDTAANSGFVNMAGGIGIDTTTANFAQTFGSVNVTGSWCSMVASLNVKLTAGYHYIQHVENSVATGTTTWAGDLGNIVMQTGLVAKVKG